MNPSVDDLKKVVSALTLIFWGSLIFALDLSFVSFLGRQRWENVFIFDVIDDFIGMCMIFWGVSGLNTIYLDKYYKTSLRIVNCAIVLVCIQLFFNHFTYELTSYPLFFINKLFSIASSIAVLLFCQAMRKLSSEADLQQSETGWQKTLVLCFILYIVSEFTLSWYHIFFANTSGNFPIGVYILLNLIISIISLVSLIVLLRSMHLMRREIKDKLNTFR